MPATKPFTAVTSTIFGYTRTQIRQLVGIYLDNGQEISAALSVAHGAIWRNRDFETTLEIIRILERINEPCHPPEALDNWIKEATDDYWSTEKAQGS